MFLFLFFFLITPSSIPAVDLYIQPLLNNYYKADQPKTEKCIVVWLVSFGRVGIIEESLMFAAFTTWRSSG